MKMLRTLAGVTFSTCLASATVQAGVLVIPNGSFESPSGANPKIAGTPTSWNALGGATTDYGVANSVQVGLPAVDGVQAGYQVTSGAAAGFSETLTGSPIQATDYTFTFVLGRGNPESGPEDFPTTLMAVYPDFPFDPKFATAFGNTAPFNDSFHPAGTWQTYTITYTAAELAAAEATAPAFDLFSTPHFFTFRIDPQGAGTVYIDSVTATFVDLPEPATLGVLALGGLALVRRRRTAVSI